MKRRGSITSALAVLTIAAISLVARGASAACSPASVTLSEIPTWMPPVTGASCTQADANALDTALNDQNATAATIEGSVSASCQSCVFTESANASAWQLIVWIDKTNDEYIFNGGACLAAAGAAQDCASSFYTAGECEEEACSACTDESDYDTCASAADTAGSCTSTATAENSACGTSATAAMNACNYGTNATSSVAPLVLELCGGGSSGSAGSSTSSGSSGSSSTGSETGSGGPAGGVGSSSGSSGSNSSTGDSANDSNPKVVQLGDTPPTETGGCNASAEPAGDTSYATAIALAFACATIIAKIKRRSRLRD